MKGWPGVSHILQYPTTRRRCTFVRVGRCSRRWSRRCRGHACRTSRRPRPRGTISNGIRQTRKGGPAKGSPRHEGLDSRVRAAGVGLIWHYRSMFPVCEIRADKLRMGDDWRSRIRLELVVRGVWFSACCPRTCRVSNLDSHILRLYSHHRSGGPSQPFYPRLSQNERWCTSECRPTTLGTDLGQTRSAMVTLSLRSRLC